MAYADENAPRRNLTVTSLCFIIYYLAGGEFLNSTVTLLVINIEFTKPVILAAIAWLLLFWFALRYWQIHRNKIGMTSDEDLKSIPYFVYSKLAIWYVEKKTGKKFRT